MKKINFDKYRSLILLVLFSAVISFLYPGFLTSRNLLNVLRQTSINAIIAGGMTFVILTGGIDLSVGSILGFTGAVLARLLSSGYNFWLALLAAIAIGAVVGAINGFIITKWKLQPFIVTLAMMILLRGSTMVFTDGKPIAVTGDQISPLFRRLGTGNINFFSILKVPVPIVIMIILFAIAFFILTQTKFGRHIYAVGGNEAASLLSGINTDRVKIWTYAISGVMATIAGLIVTSRLSSAQPTAGESYEMDAIAAVVLGGTSMVGGQGTIIGTIIGALIIGILNNALNLMDVQSYYQMIAKAIVILLAVLLDKKEKTT